jgi:dTDP-4-dehydrorhamnose 3,5-epimerase
MPMKDIRIVETEIDGVRLIEVDCFYDDRGFFFESYHRQRFAAHGIDHTFVQDNHSRSKRHVLRGFHYQNAVAPQHRLVRCTVGEVWDVVVDLRVGGPTFGRWLGFTLKAEEKKHLLIPPEFAHGFVVLSDFAEIQYKVTAHHNPAAEVGLLWDDPDVGVRWPVASPILSPRDRTNPTLKDYLAEPAFKFPGRP